MEKSENFLLNPSLKEMEKIKGMISDILGSEEYLIMKSDIRKWFFETDTQGEYTKEYLMPPKKSSAPAEPMRVDQLKSYHFLKERLNMTDRDIKEHTKVSFDQYLKQKNIQLNEDTDINDDDLLFDDALIEDDVASYN